MALETQQRKREREAVNGRGKLMEGFLFSYFIYSTERVRFQLP